MKQRGLTGILHVMLVVAWCACGVAGDESSIIGTNGMETAEADGDAASGEDCSERETWAMPFCDDDWLPQAGDGCYQSCSEGEPACREGTCTHAWLGGGPEDDCGLCGTDGLICM